MPINRSRNLVVLALCAAVTLELCAAATLPSAASAKAAPTPRTGPLPKLQRVAPLATAMPGAHVPVRATLKGRSAQTRLTYLLSADRRPSASDRKLGSVAVPALSGGKTRIVTRTLTIPARGRTGSWYLLACVGAGAPRRCSAVPLPVLAKPSPRSVTVSTDAGHAAGRLITTDGGGTVTATGADGSTYALTLPVGALASDETITLTPVSALSGLKAGATVAGVQIAPDGLALIKPATLTITPAHAVPVADQIGYFWHGTGRESGLYPPTTDPKSFTLSLNHFSGYELVDGNRVARKQLANQPTDVQDRYGDLAQAIADLRATESQPFTVYRLSIDATLREVIGHNGHFTFQTPPPEIEMEMTPGAYTEPFTVQCPHNSPFSGAQKVFTGGWIVTHQSEVTPQGHWILQNWTPGTNGVLAQKTYDQTLTDPDGMGTNIRQQTTDHQGRNGAMT